jgi:hypothetical protein
VFAPRQLFLPIATIIFAANLIVADHVFGEGHLRRVLKSYVSYYNPVRTHLSLNKDAPEFRQAQPIGSIMALPALGGLHHHYIRV